jgi:hypothetical protein
MLMCWGCIQFNTKMYCYIQTLASQVPPEDEMAICKLTVMLPHISKTGDTTHEASFCATDSIKLLIHPVLIKTRS